MYPQARYTLLHLNLKVKDHNERNYNGYII